MTQIFLGPAARVFTVNDVHSRLNPTPVARIVRPSSPAEVGETIAEARERGESVAICGGRHAMGGQQFATGRTLIDMTRLDGLGATDGDGGLLEVGAGAMWPAVIAATRQVPGPGDGWAIRQKQTGADDLTLGGAVAANIHGRGLDMHPFVGDVESLTLVNSDGHLVRCSRTENPALFSLVAGGYGLFGVVCSVVLRLSPRRRVRRAVRLVDAEDLEGTVRERVASGFTHGDFQFAIDPSDERMFLRRGVFSCYQPVEGSVPVSAGDADLPRERWLDLLHLAHTDKALAFREYSRHYLSTDGNIYWSDTQQLSTYIPSYADYLGQHGSASREADQSLMIGEMFVPRPALLAFLHLTRGILRRTGAEPIYGVVRFVRQDTETFLPWATGDFAGIVLNILTSHSAAGIARTSSAFRELIDAALSLGGTFYLTYHRWATRQQVERAYPRFAEFLALQRRFDPDGIFRSDWLRHMQGLFA